MGKLTQTTAQVQEILDIAAKYPEPSIADVGKTPVVNSEGTGFDLQTPQGGGMSNPMTAAGDMIAGSIGGAPYRIPKGTRGQVLTMGESFPEWQTIPSANGQSF